MSSDVKPRSQRLFRCEQKERQAEKLNKRQSLCFVYICLFQITFCFCRALRSLAKRLSLSLYSLFS